VANEKQLSIIVKARDQASGVLKGVGDSAGETGNKFNLLNEAAETGHGLHSMLRQARNISIAFELIPVGVTALTAAFATLHGSAEDAAKGQRALYEGIKGIPLVGKPAGEAAEWLGAKLAHAFGKQSTAEMEADIKAKEDILKEFAETEKKLAADLGKNDNEASLVNLLPSEAEIQKAKEKYAATINGLKVYEANLIKAGGAGQDVRGAISEVARIKADAAKVEQAEIAKAHAVELAEQNQFASLVREAAQHSADEITKLVADGQEKTLEAENRGYEARLLSLETQLKQELNAITEAEQKILAEYDKQAAALQSAADVGDQKAIQRIKDIEAAKLAAQHSAGDQKSAATNSAYQLEMATKDKAIQDARLSNLRQEAAAGDENAKVLLEQLNSSREREATERALLAIMHDERATDQQRADAGQQLAESRKAQVESGNATLLANEQSILEKQAALGDEGAAKRLRELELTKQQRSEEAQLQAIASDSLATDQQKLEAEQQLLQLSQLADQQAKQAAGNEIKDAGLFLLQQEASLGDKLAAQQVKKLQLEKEYGEEKKKLLDVINDERSGDDARADARKILSGLDAAQTNAEKQASLDNKSEDKTPALATLQDSQYLTGVQARAEQERDQYEPVVQAQALTTQAVNDLAATLKDYFKNQNSAQRKVIT
jgi:hypothetical protein